MVNLFFKFNKYVLIFLVFFGLFQVSFAMKIDNNISSVSSDGSSCIKNSDCMSKHCSYVNDIYNPGGFSKKCISPTCSDGIQNGDETDIDVGGNCSIIKKNNTNNNFNEYNNFLNFLKENFIINIHGIRNDSSIQYMSINLKEGNLIEGDNSDASILFEIEQDSLKKIFRSNNIGREFFKEVVSGEIKLSKLDNRGVFEKVGSWVNNIFSNKKNEINLSISCPNVEYFVCGKDGKTYKNGCIANQNNIEIKYQGKCIKPKVSCKVGNSCFDLDLKTCNDMKGNFGFNNCNVIVSLTKNNMTLIKNETLIDRNFLIKNESDLENMFVSILNFRKEGLVAADIWDNFGIGKIFHNNIKEGKIDMDNFLKDKTSHFTNLDNKNPIGGSSKNSDFNSNFKTGEESSNVDDFDPLNGKTGGINIGDGLGNMRGGQTSSGDSNSNYNSNSGDGQYDGQMGSDGGYDMGYWDKIDSSFDNDNNDDSSVSWSVDAKDSSYQHSGEDGFSSFTHHHSSVTGDNGYSSTTDKQSFTGSDGTTITRVSITQNYPDGSSKTFTSTTVTDKDGNSRTSSTTTTDDGNGNVESHTNSNGGGLGDFGSTDGTGTGTSDGAASTAGAASSGNEESNGDSENSNNGNVGNAGMSGATGAGDNGNTGSEDDNSNNDNSNSDDGWGNDDFSNGNDDSSTDDNSNSDSEDDENQKGPDSGLGDSQDDSSNDDSSNSEDDDCEFDCPGDSGSELPPDANDNYYDPSYTPSEQEIEMAMKRILGLFGLGGGINDGADNGRSDGGSVTNAGLDPSKVGCSDDGCTDREVDESNVNGNLLVNGAKGPVIIDSDVGEGLH